MRPRYTPEAMRAKLQGVVKMELVVLPDGTVGAARVIQSLEAGLDRAALVAARYWYFNPPKVDGVPVAATVFMDLEFRLR